MKKYSYSIQIFYAVSFIVLIIQALSILCMKSMGSSEFFDFNYEDELNLGLHFILVAVNIIYLILRKNEPEKWMTVVNSVVGLFSINFERYLFMMMFLYNHFR